MLLSNNIMNIFTKFYSTIGSLIFSIVILLSASYANSTEFDEAAIDASNQVKSRYINTFIKFVDWSNIPSVMQSHEVIVCMTGDRKLAEKFAAIPNNPNSQINIKLDDNPKENELNKCNVIFIGKGAEEKIPSIISKINNLTILTISEARYFIDNGGILEMGRNDNEVGLFDKNKLNLKVNINKVEEINLKIDARLLQIASKERK